MVMTGFGLVTQDNAGFFVPFNSTTEPFNKTKPASHKRQSQATFGITNQQQDDAYTAWLQSTYRIIFFAYASLVSSLRLFLSFYRLPRVRRTRCPRLAIPFGAGA